MTGAIGLVDPAAYDSSVPTGEGMINSLDFEIKSDNLFLKGFLLLN